MNETQSGKELEDKLDMKSIVLQIAELLKDKKAKDILVLGLGKLTSITDYFIIATANSSVQIKALVRFIEELMNGNSLKPLSRNDTIDSPWVLIDYNYFIIHLFLREGRNYYQLEKLWTDAPVVYSDKGGI
jgi:ribosome-associated protein